MSGESDENSVVDATRRIGRLVEIIEGIFAVAEFEGLAQKAATEIAEVGRLIVREGNPGDDAINDWLAAMLDIYRRVCGKEPATSVGASNRPNEGIAEGPLIRFLQAAGKPLKIELSEDAWRSRVRTILRGAGKTENDLASHVGLDLAARHIRAVMRQGDSIAGSRIICSGRSAGPTFRPSGM